MPLRIHGRVYKNFYTAVGGVMRWKRWRGASGKRRARAYVAVVMRRQDAGRRYHQRSRWRIVCHGRTKSWHVKKSTAQHRLTKRMRRFGCRVVRA